MRLLDRLFKRKAKPVAEETKLAPAVETRPVTSEAAAPTLVKPKPEGPYLTKTVVFGVRWPGEDSSVCFVDEEQGIRKQLVDSDGRIQDFPGIVEEAFWTEQVSSLALKPQIHFRTSFEKRENGWLMLWNIQPDGRYWADDDGFGMEDEEEVTLYTYVDKNGQFTGPFRVYRVGNHHYSLDRFEHQRVKCHSKNLQKLKEWNLVTEYVQKPEDLLFPRLRSDPYHDYLAFWDREEALAYWNHPVLSKDLLEATEILLNTQKPIHELGGYPCQYHIHASMTLFWLITGDSRFRSVLDKFYDGELYKDTADRLG